MQFARLTSGRLSVFSASLHLEFTDPDAFAELSAIVPDVEIGVRQYHADGPQAIADALARIAPPDAADDAAARRGVSCLRLVGDANVGAAAAGGTPGIEWVEWAPHALQLMSDANQDAVNFNMRMLLGDR